jgi:hypothetical protein
MHLTNKMIADDIRITKVQVFGKFVQLSTTRPKNETVLEFLNNLWGLGTEKGIGLSYRPARPRRLAELVPWNRFLGPLKV